MSPDRIDPAAAAEPLSMAPSTLRLLIIGLIGFFTLVDLFATQALLPTLAADYGVSPSAMGVAVNASTIGMAVAGLAVAFVNRLLDRRWGTTVSLVVLALPTLLLAFAPDLATFTALRALQGVFMVTAFTLTMAYLSEENSASGTANALAAYITGAVAANLVGRLIAGSVADMYGLDANFFVFAALNVLGAGLAFFTLTSMRRMATPASASASPLESWALHLADARLRASFAIGFLILFAFIGTFSYVNFVLARAPIGLSTMSLGLVYFVFLPAMVTTPLAGRTAERYGARRTFWAALGVAGLGLPLLLLPTLAPVLVGLALIGAGTFFAQATATGYVGRTAKTDRAAASGLYLASYYLGGLAGAAAIGQIFDAWGWTASVIGIAVSLALAALCALVLSDPVAARAAPAWPTLA